MRPRLPVPGLALAATAGVVLADRLALPLPVLLGVSGASALVCAVRPRAVLCLLCACAAFAALHTLRWKQRAEREGACTPQLATRSGIVWSDPQQLAGNPLRQTGAFRLRTAAGALLLATWVGPLPVYGDRVTLSGQLRAIDERRNPGELDFATQLRRSGVFAQIEAASPQDCRIDGHDAGNPFVALSLRTSRWIAGQLRLDLDDSPEIATLITSMVLGLRGETPAEMKDMFRTTGTLHLFAVSGLNIAMLAIIAGCGLRPLGLGRRFVAAVTIPILVFYAFVTGLSASCVRAAIMGSLVLLGIILDRPTVIYNSLAAAAVLILAWDTNQLFVPGFQFSFVLVFAIVALADRISRRLEPLGHPDRFLPKPLWTFRQRALAAGAKLLAGAIGVTLASWFGSLTFMAGDFHIVSPAAILANLIAVPIAFCVLALGVATLLTAPIVKPVAILFNNANWLCAKALLWTVKTFALLPGGHVYVELPKAERPPACEITVLDVGAGAAIHLRSGRADWLIDGGTQFRADSITLPYLRSRGVNRLDALLLTHGDTLHIGAAAALAGDVRPRMILDSAVKDRSSTRRKLHADLAAQGRGFAFARRGDEFALGSGRLRVLFPPPGWQRDLADDKALVLLLECEGRRVLFTSDAGFSTEQWLLENEPALRADVLVKGQHHGGDSGAPDLLQRVQPGAIVASALDYGARPEQLDRWCADCKRRGIAVFRQDECGAVMVAIRDGAIEMRGFVNGQSFRSRAR